MWDGSGVPDICFQSGHDLFLELLVDFVAPDQQTQIVDVLSPVTYAP